MDPPGLGKKIWEKIWNRGVEKIGQGVEMIDQGVEKTFQLAEEEIKFLMNAPNEVKSIEKKLKDIKSDMKKADFISDREEEFDTWVSQLRVLAFMVEDVVEVYKNNATTYEGCDVWRVIKGSWCQLTTLHKLKGEIDNFNLKHAELPEEKPEFRERSREDGETSNPLREKGGPSSETEEGDVVGFKEEEHKLETWLTQDEGRGCRVIVSIWGTGGAGKTSLAHKIYKNSSVTSQFDCVAWATVSQKCVVEAIWQAVLDQIWDHLPKEEKEKLQTVDAREKVKACLKGKDYLIILDDIWEKKHYQGLIKAFPQSPDKKCRILVTARTGEVGGLATHPLQLRPLNSAEARHLFFIKVYPSAPYKKPDVSTEQEHWATEILKFCKGLPMAIVILGGMLQSGRAETDAWRKMGERVQSELAESREIVDTRKVIALSYIDLSHNLRSCFLYLGFFPEDSMIDCDKLIRLWLAEGFLEQQGHNDDPMEYVAERCLDGLIQRSMIQVVQRKSNGNPEICCTHDLIRDFAKEEAEKAQFSSIFKEQPLPSVEGIRRIALHPKDTQDQIPGTSSSVPLRSKHLISSHPQSSLPSSGKRPHDVEGGTSSGKRARLRVVEGDDLVGVQDKVDELVSLLKNEEPLGRLSVVSIVGHMGTGKTAVAQKVYDDAKSHFDGCCPWVHVSPNFELNHILWVILKQCTSLTDEEMKGKEKLQFHDLLKKKKKYLIVLDNLHSKYDWDIIKKVFPKPLKGQKCRVLLTIRIPNEALFGDRSIHCVELERLNEDLSLELFLKTIFKCSLYDLSEEMRGMARKMVVEYCERIPSAILALGSLLSEKEVTDSVWNETLKSLDQKVEGFCGGMEEVFRVCYFELPDHLRSCIWSLYCLLNWDDADIKTLVEHWDAKELKNNESIEDHVVRACQELIQRKLIDVVKAGRSTSHHHSETYKMQHAFYCVVQLRLSGINKISGLAEGSQPPSCNDDPKDGADQDQYGTSIALPPDHSKQRTFSVSRLMSYLDPSKYNRFPNHVHSLLCFSKNPQFGDEQFPLLRVVDLEGAEKMKEVPKAIEKLILLRYLSLRGTGVREIPRWIAYLHNLQTLDAPKSNIPIEALHLPKLRYLFAASFYGPSSSTRLCAIGLLKHLHTLELLDTADWIIDGLDELTNLRVLRLHCGEDTVFILRRSNDGEVNVNVFGAVAMLKGLKSLYLSLKRGGSLTSSSSQRTDAVHSLSFSSDSDLEEMILRGTMVKLPTELNDFPKWLKYLWLETYVDNDMDPFSTLQRLPSLKKLCLRLFRANDNVKSNMTCFADGFPELETLYVSIDFVIDSDQFTWIVDGGALRNLKVLHIEVNGFTGWLGRLPVGLSHVTTLKELILTRCYDVRVELARERGENWEEVKGMKSNGLSFKFFDESNMKP